MDLTQVSKHQRIGGDDRTTFGAALAHEYHEDEVSIRDLAEKYGRSYGFIHRMLLEAGVELRKRGGPRGASPKAVAQSEQRREYEQRLAESGPIKKRRRK